NAEIVRYPRGGAGPTGRIVEILGRPGGLGVDTGIIIRKHHLPDVFHAEVLEEAERSAHSVNPREAAASTGLPHLPGVPVGRDTPGVIRSVDRMPHTNVNNGLEGDAEMSGRYSALVPHFLAMKELALLLNARRNEHGSIDFDLPEPVIEFDAEQRMTNIMRSE